MQSVHGVLGIELMKERQLQALSPECKGKYINMTHNVVKFSVTLRTKSLTRHPISYLHTHYDLRLILSSCKPTVYVSTAGIPKQIKYRKSLSESTYEGNIMLKAFWFEGKSSSDFSIRNMVADGAGCTLDDPYKDQLSVFVPNRTLFPNRVILRIHYHPHNTGLFAILRPYFKPLEDTKTKFSLFVHNCEGKFSGKMSPDKSILNIRKYFQSWNSASELCHQLGAHLPIFFDKEYTEEFVSVIKAKQHELSGNSGLFINLKVRGRLRAPESLSGCSKCLSVPNRSSPEKMTFSE